VEGADPIGRLRTVVQGAAGALHRGDSGPAPTLERPRRPDQGDYSSNVAMVLAGSLGQAPREVAERLQAPIIAALGPELSKVEVAGPGFINLFLADPWYRSALAALLALGERMEVGPVESSRRISVEFVSANPTGPLTAAGGRHAAYGDAVARLLEAVGHQVSREYYVNDTGGQIERFAQSVAAQMTGAPPPEDGYEGEYVAALARTLLDEDVAADDLDAVVERSVELTVAGIRASLEAYRVHFDNWFSERELHRAGAIEVAIAALRERGHVYKSEGAIWLRTSELGDDKDRVLIRSSGEATYFAADIAYHRDKLDRGFELLIDVLGADHHGYVERMRAAIAGLGGEPSSYEALIMQLVHVVEGGQRAQMSKRRGEFVTLDELVEDIGVDATRFFMLARTHDTAVDLDLALARRQSSENPVYYVQYAHARIASIIRKGGDDALRRALEADLASLAAPVEPAERVLLKRLLELPGEVAEAAARRAPHRLCAYATAIAADFHAFYRDCQVLGLDDRDVEASRLATCVVSKRAIARVLDLLGITAPERM
jgi:arginyl-tRNA synthetase